jgi:hypothetical protein
MGGAFTDEASVKKGRFRGDEGGEDVASSEGGEAGGFGLLARDVYVRLTLEEDMVVEGVS